MLSHHLHHICWQWTAAAGKRLPIMPLICSQGGGMYLPRTAGGACAYQPVPKKNYCICFWKDAVRNQTHLYPMVPRFSFSSHNSSEVGWETVIWPKLLSRLHAQKKIWIYIYGWLCIHASFSYFEGSRTRPACSNFYEGETMRVDGCTEVWAAALKGVCSPKQACQEGFLGLFFGIT